MLYLIASLLTSASSALQLVALAGSLMLSVLQPDRLPDEEITELEERLKSLMLHQSTNNNVAGKDCSSLKSPSQPYPPQGNSLPPQLTFIFQGQQFGE